MKVATVSIPIHSIVDVITNSSSVIYTEASANAISLAKKIINTVLATAGSDKTAEDLFDFAVRVRPADIIDWLSNNMYDSDLGGLAAFGASKEDMDELMASEKLMADGRLDYHGRRNAIRAWATKHEVELGAFFDTQESDIENGMINTLVVTTKNGVDIDFANSMLSMFTQEASYNG